MIQNEIAKKYSQAIFSLAEEKDKFIEFKKDLNKVWDVISENDELENALFHPRVEISEKKQILKRLFEGEISKELFNFLSLLVEKRRIFYLKVINDQFNNLVNKRKNILEIEVVSAIELDDTLNKKLKNKIQKELDFDVMLKNTVDPDIIAGLILKIGDKIIDGSIRQEINDLKEKIEQIPVSKLGVEWYESETRRN